MAGVRLEDHTAWATSMARTLCRRYAIQGERARDVQADALLGLVLAGRDFQPGRGVGFRTFAQHRVRGSMLDGLRGWDGQSRRVGYPLSLSEPDLALTVERMPAGDQYTAVTLRVAAAQTLTRRELAAVFDTIVDGQLLKAVAARYGVTTPRAFQIRRDALGKLQAAFA